MHHVRGSHYFLRKSDRNVVIPLPQPGSQARNTALHY
ncbi:MAG TPA: hypothetical protein VMT20_27720 [Terriglobia bacterium]|nr:hypothetical protein [Terriglobia bacterium]